MTLLRLASAAEGRSILAAEDDFTRALGGFDRSFRLGTTAAVSDAELRQFLGEQAVDFTDDEAEAWESTIAAVAQGAQGIGAMLPAEVLVVKTTGREERNHAYTRANAIVLPAVRVERLRRERAIYLLAHELFHVASRASPTLRDATHALLGFTPIAPIPPPLELDSRRLTNPDAHSLGHYIRLGARTVIPLLTSSMPLAEAIGRSSASVVDLMQVSLLEIDPHAGTAVRDAAGEPVLLEAAAMDWSQRIGRNTRYTLHPEEVLADNLALLVRRRLGSSAHVAHPAFLREFEEAFCACADGTRTR
jgi:hypothetical protein